MRINGFDELKDLMREAKSELTPDELHQKVKKVFKKAVDSMKENGDRPTLNVGKIFLENYHKENGIEGMKNLLSKLSLLVDKEGFEYLVSIKVIKKKTHVDI